MTGNLLPVPPIAAPGRSVRHLCERRGGAESRRARAMAPPGPHPYLQSSCLPVCCSFAVFLQFRGSTTCFAPPNPEALMTRSPRTRLNSLLVAALAFVASSVASAQGIESPRVPLRTAINEINALRDQYAEGFNKKDAPALTAMYLPDAVVIRRDGSTLVGKEAIGKALAEESAKWAQTTFSSDTMRVYGNTAWDVGTMKSPS